MKKEIDALKRIDLRNLLEAELLVHFGEEASSNSPPASYLNEIDAEADTIEELFLGSDDPALKNELIAENDSGSSEAILGITSLIEAPQFRFHSTSADVIDLIFSGGFRTDLPDPDTASKNNRFGRAVYISHTPATSLSERPGGMVLLVSVNLGKNLNIGAMGPIYNMDEAQRIANEARRNGYNSITTHSVVNGAGFNDVVFDPVHVIPVLICKQWQPPEFRP